VEAKLLFVKFQAGHEKTAVFSLDPSDGRELPVDRQRGADDDALPLSMRHKNVSPQTVFADVDRNRLVNKVVGRGVQHIFDGARIIEPLASNYFAFFFPGVGHTIPRTSRFTWSWPIL
jgi:hypothetical protein